MKYTIQDRSEETECKYCGCPLYVGDKVVESKDQSNVFCSESCAVIHSSRVTVLT